MKKKETKKALKDRHQDDVVRPQILRKWKEQYRLLCLIRARLLRDRAELIEDSRYPVGIDGIHMADLATDEFERDIDLSLLSAEEDALFEIDEAMRRIERGSYGVCELTGKPIPLSRLRAIPWTRFTADAEEELERQGTVSRATLGKLGRVEIEPAALDSGLELMQAPQKAVPPPPLEKLEEIVRPTTDEEEAGGSINKRDR